MAVNLKIIALPALFFVSGLSAFQTFEKQAKTLFVGNEVLIT